ncbi:hypothetical protein [Pseudaestuariivita rosea]|uniref:hypothetical protein n=1 Tax=Pseudaestuariivita rosea TaxID=2763263 RepID=UPI001ABB9F72|nr:hypothetical protein [Pseudaestuariivita rosea]
MNSLNTDDLTKAERAWVQRAIKHRKQMIVLKLVSMALTLLLYVGGPSAYAAIAFFFWGSDFEESRIVGIMFTITAIVTCLYGIVFVIRREVSLRVMLSEVEKSHARDLTRADKVSVSLSNHSDKELNYHLSIKTPFRAVGPVQIPYHWSKLIPEHGDSAQGRIARISASGRTVQIQNLIRSSGSAIPVTKTYETFSDPKYILLSFGPLSVNREHDAGLGLPRFDSHALSNICITLLFFGLVMLFFVWAAMEDDRPRLAIIFLMISAALIAPFGFRYLRRGIRHLRLRRLYRDDLP